MEDNTQQGPSNEVTGTLNGTVEDSRLRPEDGGFKLKFCTVCANNQNRYALLVRFHVIPSKLLHLVP